ncbi:sigma-70 family RNA polymerase sigma factor [Nocardioides lijunqiniae]|uniref:sigma-70 family RNA polymerase sigma factor n=1 Tax=Nocardioides lijunqiniae TaxID=2760832 RepID=UPI00187865C1
MDAPPHHPGDDSDIGELFERHARMVYRYARARLDQEDAEDAVSEVFVVAARRTPPAGLDPAAWLLGVARNVVANQVRSLRRRRALVARAELTAPRSDPDHAPWLVRLDALRAAVATLSARDQEVVSMLAAAPLTPEQLAAALGCSPRAAAVRVHRARQRLRSALAATESDGPTDTTPRPERTSS